MAQEVTIVIRGDDQASGDLRKVQGEIKGQKESVDEASKSNKKMGAATAALGASLVAVAGSVAVARAAFVELKQQMTAAVQTAGEFEQALVNAGARAEATDAQLRQMSEAALEAGQSSVFSANEAADALGFLAMAGFEVEEQTAALPGVLDLAAAGQLDLAEASDIASNVLTGFALEVDEIGRVNDVLAKTSTSANTNVQQLGQSMADAAPIAAATGQSVEEVSALLGTLANAGIRGSRAGRGLRTALARLQDPTDKMQSALADANTEVRTSDGEIRSLTAILADLEKGSEDVGTTITQVFGRESGAVLQSVMNEGSEAVRELEEELQNSGGTAEEMAEKQIDTLQGSLKILKSQFEAVQIQLGGPLAEVFRQAVDIATTFFETLNNPAVIDRVGGALEELGAALGENEEGLTTLTEAIAIFLAEGAAELIESTTRMVELMSAVSGETLGAAEAIGVVDEEASQLAQTMQLLEAGWHGMGVVVEASQMNFTGAASSILEASGAMGDASGAAQELREDVEFEEELQNLKDGFDNAKDAASGFWEGAQKGAKNFQDQFKQTLGIVQQGDQEQEESQSGALKLLEMELEALRTKDEIKRQEIERDKAIAEIKQQDLGTAEEEKRIAIERQKAANAIRKIRREQANESREKNREEREANEIAEHRLAVLEAETEREAAKEEAALKRAEVEQKDLTRKQRKAALLEIEKNLEERLAELDAEARSDERGDKIAEKKIEMMRTENEERKAQLQYQIRLLEIQDEDLSKKERQNELLEAQKELEEGIAAAQGKQDDDDDDEPKNYERMADAAQASGAVIASEIGNVIQTIGELEEGEASVADAMGATGQAVTTFAEQMGASAEAQAGIMAVFETAMGFATLFTNPAESAGHFIAAANFGLIAATGGSGKESGGGKATTSATQDADRKGEEAAKEGGRVFAETAAEESGGTGGGVVYVDFSGATMLESAPATQNRIEESVERAKRRKVSRGRRG